MKTKSFYLCLLFLLLGTANMWADKYYTVSRDKTDSKNRYNSLSDLAASGEKFMIYNTAMRLVGMQYEYKAPDGVNFVPEFGSYAPDSYLDDSWNANYQAMGSVTISMVDANGTVQNCGVVSPDKMRYQNRTAVSVIEVKPGATVRTTVSNANWMNAYIYLDKDNDGFSVEVDNAKRKVKGDILSYSFYTFGGDYGSDGNLTPSGWNDKGDMFENDGRNTRALSDFKAPQVPGKYRMRVKTDWDNVDPGEGDMGTATIVDFILLVTDDEKTYSDHTGFIYHSGTGFGLTKSKEQDIDIYNDCHLFTLEASDTPNLYYLKSVAYEAYVDFDGNLKENKDGAIAIYPWESATGDTQYDGNGNYVSNGTIKEEIDIYSELSNYTIMRGYNMTETERAFIVKWNGGDWYWSCNEAGNGFKTEQTGQPFAFYRVNEVWPEYYSNIRDLHIYSRCDIYSAQQIYGYVKIGDYSSYSCNYPSNPVDGTGYQGLLDGDYATYFHSGYSGHNPGPDDEKHYLQVDLGDGVTTNAFHIYFKKRMQNNNNRPTEILIQGSNDKTVWNDITTLTGLPTDEQVPDYYSNNIVSGTAYRYLRFTVNQTNTGSRFFTFSEFYVLPNNDIIEDAREYFDSELPINATASVYTNHLLRLNNEAAEVKLLSGVPLPGNKYRIYADAYSGGAWVNRDVSTNDAGELVASKPFESDNDYFVWECVQLPNGKLAFKNEKTGKYLANGTTDDAVYSWDFSTNETYRHGVPLFNSGGEYLAVYNSGATWEPGVNMAQNQTGYKMYKETTTVDGVNKTVIKLDETKNICTDFVFLPVLNKPGEKKITIMGEPLTKRNSYVTYEGEHFVLPFSCIVDENSTMPVVTSTVPGYHNFIDLVDAGGTSIGTTIEYDEIAEIVYLTAKFEIVGTPEKYSNDAPHVYAIKNVRNGKYVKFAGETTNMLWSEEIGVETMFYFTDGEFVDHSHYSAFINSIITTKQLYSATNWTPAGNIYYIQPNECDGKLGFAITSTKLDEKNNPEGLCGNDQAAINKVLSYNVEDGGALWVFEEVTGLCEKIKQYIDAEADKIYEILTEQENATAPAYPNNYNQSKIDAYRALVQALENEAMGYSDDSNIARLIEITHDIYTYKFEVNYGTLALPLTSVCQENTKTDPYNPNWYYVRNVASPNHIAKYVKENENMQLFDVSDSETVKQLDNLFYISGDVINKNGIGEYFQGHIHNFKAHTHRGDSYDETVVDRTLVSGNDELFEDKVIGDGVVNQKISQFQTLKANTAWQVTLEGGSDGRTFNHWGSSLLASGQNALADNYSGGFQFYLQADGDIVVKLTGWDTFNFEHTRGAYSYFKIVLSYNGSNYITIEVTNSLGKTERKEANLKNLNVVMKDVTEVCTAIPNGINITSIKGETIKTMTWNEEHGENTWFIMPSTNTTYPGLAIVVKSPDDGNLGWSNVEDKNGTRNTSINTYLGSDGYSTWEFVEVTDFKAHMEQMLDLWRIDECRVYYKELAALWDDMNRIYNECAETDVYSKDSFNEMVALVRKYNGADKVEYLHPKRGRLYTIRPAYNGGTDKFLAVDEHNKVVMRNIYGDVLSGAPEDGKKYYIYANTYYDGKFVSRYFYNNGGALQMSTERGSEAYMWVCSKDANTNKYSFRNVGDGSKYLAHKVLSGSEHLFQVGRAGGIYAGTTLWTDNVDANGGRYLVVKNDGGSFDQSTGRSDAKNTNHTTDIVFVPCDEYEYDSRGVWFFEDKELAQVEPLPNGLIPDATYHIYANLASGNKLYLCDNNGSLSATSYFVDSDAFSWTCIKNDDNTFSFQNGNGKYLADTNNYHMMLGDVPAKYDATKRDVLFNMAEYTGGKYMVVKNDGTAFDRTQAETNDLYCSSFVFDMHLTDDIVNNFVVKNLHTQSHMSAFGADSTSLHNGKDVSWIVNDGDVEATVVDVDPLVASKVNINIEGDYMQSNNDETLVVSGGNTPDNGEGVNRYKWYIEEVRDYEKIFATTDLPSHGHTAFILGYDAKVPEGLHAYWPAREGTVFGNRYISMKSYDNGILPANEPVLLKVDGISSDPNNFTGTGEKRTYKFYYSTTPCTEQATDKLDGVLYGSLYNIVVDCATLDDERGDCNIYMFQMSKDLPKLYWIYEEYNSNGVLYYPNSDEGRHIVSKANKVFFVFDKKDVGNIASFTLRFNMGPTTGIEDIIDDYRHEVGCEPVAEGIFDLQGRRIDEITVPGIYIVNGKKIVVK